MANTFLLNGDDPGGQIVEKRDGVWRVELDSGHAMDAYSGTTGAERDDYLGSIRCTVSRAGADGYACRLLPVEGATPATFLQAPAGDAAEEETGDEFELAFPQAGEGTEAIHIPIRGEARTRGSTGEQWAFEIDFTFKTPTEVTIGDTTWAADSAIAPVRTGADGPRAWVQLLEAAPTDAENFKRAVLERQVANARAAGRAHYDAVPESELAVVEGSYRMRTEAAERCRELLERARASPPRTGSPTPSTPAPTAGPGGGPPGCIAGCASMRASSASAP